MQLLVVSLKNKYTSWHAKLARNMSSAVTSFSGYASNYSNFGDDNFPKVSINSSLGLPTSKSEYGLSSG